MRQYLNVPEVTITRVIVIVHFGYATQLALTIR